MRMDNSMNRTRRAKSVLILEDDVFQANVLKRDLIKHGYQVTKVTPNGTLAIQAVKNCPPDIALLDIQLDNQKIDGIEVGHVIQKIDPNIVIIYITAAIDIEVFERALQSGLFGFIEKPYKIRTLCRQIEIATKNAIKRKDETTTKTTNASRKTKIICFPDAILINEGDNDFTKVPIQNISHITIDNVWVDIHTAQKKFCIITTLTQLAQELDYSELMRIHSSHMINLKQVERVINLTKAGGKVVLKNGVELSISKSYVDDFWNRYSSEN